MPAGRPATPTALKILRGNPGKRPLAHDEPKPRPVAPECPAWLLAEAKREWRRVAPELERLGLLTMVDGAAFAGYCQAYGRWVQAERALKKHGLTTETSTGYLAPRPEVVISRQSLQLVKAFCSEFGLTPSARGRMTVPESGDDGDNPFDI